jgi:queuine/archaeosine tRNA-ribosyltransferase
MLARSEKLHLPNGDVIETPILLPSLSSRGFPDLKKIISSLEEYLYGPFLISAYDRSYKLIPKRIKFANQLIFVDSGGYECASIVDFAEADKNTYKPKKWNKSLYNKTIKNIFDSKLPKVIISYDHPRERKSIDKQIKAAMISFDKFYKKYNFIKEILIKPETANKEKQYIDISKVLKNIKKFRDIEIIGFTENELGKSLLERMNNITKIRLALSENNMKQLIHIFGSLDTLSTPLYFICGADIFDGLTWLRYAFDNDFTMYQRTHWIRNHPHNSQDIYLRQATFIQNFAYLQKLLLKMKRFLKTSDFNEFAPHSDILKEAWNTLELHEKGGL